LATEGHVVLSIDNESRATTLLDPLTFPLFARVRHLTRQELHKIGLPCSRNSWNNAVPYSRHSLKRFVVNLHKVDLMVLRSKSVGFGPFTFFNHRLFSESLGMKIQEKLQHYADKEYPLFKSTGSQYVLIAAKLPRRPSCQKECCKPNSP